MSGMAWYGTLFLHVEEEITVFTLCITSRANFPSGFFFHPIDVVYLTNTRTQSADCCDGCIVYWPV